jgi:hypothetical protein
MVPKRPQSASFSMKVPGPGSYNPNFHDKRQWERVKIGRASRESLDLRGVPGPGSYSPEIIKFKNPKRVK